MPIIIILLICLIAWRIASKKRPKSSAGTEQLSESPQLDSQNDFSQAYQRKYLFSLNEKHEFRKLAAWALDHNYYVFPKVRLLDIIEPRKDTDNYKSLLWRIQAKHVDFLICDQEMRIKFIIELDDNSHDRKDRIARDAFLAQALSGAGYSVNHTKAITEEFLQKLESQEVGKAETSST